MSKDNLNNQRIRFEKLVRGSIYKEARQDFTGLVKVYKEIAYRKLLQDGDTSSDKLITTGELKAIQKLLDVLELGSETTS